MLDSSTRIHLRKVTIRRATVLNSGGAGGYTDTMKLALMLAAAVLLASSSSAEKAPAKHKKKAAAARPRKKAPESRYKSTALSASLEEHYRFDEDGNPIDKRKPSAAAKKTAPSSADAGEGAEPAGSPDADAL